MDLENFASKLEADLIGTIGTDIYMYKMSDLVTEGILFVEPEEGATIDYELEGYFNAKFQVIVRSTDYDAGKVKADSVMTSLTVYNQALGNYAVKYVRPRTEAISNQTSEGNHIEFLLNFETIYVKT